MKKVTQWELRIYGSVKDDIRVELNLSGYDWRGDGWEETFDIERIQNLSRSKAQRAMEALSTALAQPDEEEPPESSESL